MKAPTFHVGAFKLKLVERKRWEVLIEDVLCVAELKTLAAHRYNVDDEEEWQIQLDDRVITRGEDLNKILKAARDMLTWLVACDMMSIGRED
jgi:hypothetical protein